MAIWLCPRCGFRFTGNWGPWMVCTCTGFSSPTAMVRLDDLVYDCGDFRLRIVRSLS